MSRKQQILSDSQVIQHPKTFNSANYLTVQCAQCEQNVRITIASFWRRKSKDNRPWRCHDCIKPELIKKSKENPLYKDPQFKEQFRRLHDNPEYYSKVHNKETHKRISNSSKAAWKDKKKRTNHMKHRQTKEFKDRISRWSKEQWKDPEYVAKQHELRTSIEWHKKASKKSKELWAKQEFRDKITSYWNNPEYRSKIIKILDKYRPMTVLNKNKVSKLQKSLYLILDDLGLEYHKESKKTTIQFVNRQDRLKSFIFDCLVVHQEKQYFIECHGDWFHMKPKKTALDISKSAYINKHTNAELIVLWESEFKNFDKIRETIKHRIGPRVEQIEFNFSEVQIKYNVPIDQTKVFFGRYHYLANVGRLTSSSVGAFLDNELIACAVFCNPTRQNTAARLGHKQSEVMELTRFCIHPAYQKKNFGSWFLSRATKIMRKNNPDIAKFIAFSDLSKGHVGTIYRASGWRLDGQVPPDYWYIDQNGQHHHKKSVWNRARKENQTETQYAEGIGLHKIYDFGKLRYVI